MVKWKNSDERSWTPEKNIDSRLPIEEFERRVQDDTAKPNKDNHDEADKTVIQPENGNTQEPQEMVMIEQQTELGNMANLLKSPAHSIDVTELIETLQSSPIAEITHISKPELIIHDEPTANELLQTQANQTTHLEEESQDVQMTELEPVHIQSAEKELPKVLAVPVAQPHAVKTKPVQICSTKRDSRNEIEEKPTISNHDYPPELNGNHSPQHVKLYYNIVNGKAREESVDVIDLIRPVEDGKALCLVQARAGKVWVPFDAVRIFYPMPLIKYYETRIMWTNVKN